MQFQFYDRCFIIPATAAVNFVTMATKEERTFDVYLIILLHEDCGIAPSQDDFVNNVFMSARLYS